MHSPKNYTNRNWITNQEVVFKKYYFNFSILTFSNHKNLGALILNDLQDVREFYHALGVGGLEEYIYKSS